MFGRKSDSTEVKIENQETAKACDDCGCVVLAAKLKPVDDSRYWEPRPRYYCGRCAPAYDTVRFYRDGTLHYFRRITAHSIEVTEDGKEIKPKSPAKKK